MIRTKARSTTQRGGRKMKHIWLIIAGMLQLLLMTAGIGGAAQPTPGAVYKQGELIVKYKEGITASVNANFHQRHGSRQVKEFKAYGLEHVKIASGQTVQQAIESFEADPTVLYAEPNYILHTMVVPNDPSIGNLWGMDKISAPAAWDNNIGNRSVAIGIIDTGIDYTHPDLKDNMWPGNGIYPANGYNAITGTYDPKDDNGHGSHVAGTIGGGGEQRHRHDGSKLERPINCLQIY